MCAPLIKKRVLTSDCRCLIRELRLSSGLIERSLQLSDRHTLALSVLMVASYHLEQVVYLSFKFDPILLKPLDTFGYRLVINPPRFCWRISLLEFHFSFFEGSFDSVVVEQPYSRKLIPEMIFNLLCQ